MEDTEPQEKGDTTMDFLNDFFSTAKEIVEDSEWYYTDEDIFNMKVEYNAENGITEIC